MSLKVAFQMDPIQSVDINADSTFRLAEEAQKRGHTLFYYNPENLRLENGNVLALGHDLTVRREMGDHFRLGKKYLMNLRDCDVVWLRQDPPFDMGYITYTHILDRLSGDVLVVNDPFWVRNYPEKLLVLEFPELTPPTLVARDLSALKEFKEKYKDIIIKPLYGNGGAGVFRLGVEDKNISSLHELFSCLLYTSPSPRD